MKFGDALIEDDDFDMLVMGRTQGKGRYCYVNGVLQSQLASICPTIPTWSWTTRRANSRPGDAPHVDTMP